MLLRFKKLAFIVPVNFNPMYQSALHCLGIVLDYSEYESFLIGSIRFSSDDESESVGVFSLSCPAFVDVLDTFRSISAIGGVVLNTSINMIYEMPLDGMPIQLPLIDGEMEFKLSLSDFAGTVRTENCWADIVITPAGFFRLEPRANISELTT